MDTNPTVSASPSIRTRWLGAGALAALLVVALAARSIGPHPAAAVDPTATPPEHTIAVSGVGRVILAPDVADLRVGVSFTRTTVKQARADAATAMTKVVAALKAAGIADKDIQTSTLSLSPNFDYNAGKSGTLTGYTLSNAVSATVRDLDRVGDALDGAMAAGATSVDGITFRVDNPAAAEAQARTAAMAQAKATADQLAAAAGVRITGVASVSETSATPPPVYFAGDRAAAPSAAQVATPIQAGSNQVDVTVAVTYLIN